jgi:hypothetical protein
MSRKWKILIVVVALFLCGGLALAAYFVPRIVGVFTSAYGEWYDEAYNDLLAVLNEHWAADDRVGNATVGFFFATNTGPEGSSRVMLDVRLDTSVECTLRAEDPCDALAQEYAELVVANYGRLDDIAAVRVTVNNRSGVGPLSMNRSVTVIYPSDEWPELLDEPNTANDL